MQSNHRETIGIFFSMAIIAASIYIVHEFILSLAWAGVIAIATWPVYQRVLRFCQGQTVMASSVLVTLITLVIAIPFLWLTVVVSNEIQVFTKFILHVNSTGMPFPSAFEHLPIDISLLKEKWMSTVGQPHGVSAIVSAITHTTLKPMTNIVKSLGTQVAHRTMALGFTILCLFFFYKDGKSLTEHLNAMGRYFLQDRWQLYAENLPSSINATLNGLVLVGLGIGVIMGVVYYSMSVPAPALLGAITGIFAMIPFAAPVAFGFVAILLLIEAKLIAAIVLISIGTLVMFIADHFVRPNIIGGATRLPFLAVLFGILGGVKTLGLIGLFIGPIVMVLFITLWHEADLFG